MRLARSLLAAPLLLAALPALAQTADLARATCGQLLALPRGDQGQVLLWLHGYYAGAAQRTALDRAKVNEAADAMLKACASKPELALMGAEAREIFLGNPQPQVPPSGTGVTVTTGTPPSEARGGVSSPSPAPSTSQPSAAPAPAPGAPRPVR